MLVLHPQDEATAVMSALYEGTDATCINPNAGKREVEASVPDDVPPEVAAFAGITPGGVVSEVFDFSVLKNFPMTLKLDVGASAYWSEIASMQTLDNLLQLGQIDIVDYLERIPDGYVAKRQELLSKYKLRMEQQTDAMTAGTETAPAVGVPTEKQ